MRDWVRFKTLSDQLLCKDEGNREFWRAYDARSEEVRSGMLDRFHLTDVALASLGEVSGGEELSRLSFRIGDSMRGDLQEELWLRALSAETPDEQTRAMEEYERFALEGEPVFCLDAPKATLDALVRRVLALEDGGVLIAGEGDGVVAHCPGRPDLLSGGEGASTFHRWLAARHGEVVLIDSSFLPSEIYVSRGSFVAACVRE